MDEAQGIEPLTAVVKALKPLNSEDRQRTVEAAMLYLGEKKSAKTEGSSDPESLRQDTGSTPYPQGVGPWLKQNDITPEELDQVFHFNSDGSFEIHDAPGRSKKEKTLNAYILTGLGKFLTTGQREFDDTLARAFCNTIGCYDSANHATFLKDRGAEFTGDKGKGYSITNPGNKKGAALVKEIATASK